LKNKLMGIHVGGWWAPIREAMWRFAGAEEGLKHLSKHIRQQKEAPYLKSDIPDVVGVRKPVSKGDLPPVDAESKYQLVLQPPEKIVISYISRQHTNRRKLLQEDHSGLVEALTGLVEQKNKERQAIMDAVDGGDLRDTLKRDSDEGKIPPLWEFNELYAEQMTKDDQIKATSRTTVRILPSGGAHMFNNKFCFIFSLVLTWGPWKRSESSDIHEPQPVFYRYGDILPRRVRARLPVDNQSARYDACRHLERHVSFLTCFQWVFSQTGLGIVCTIRSLR
jgi:hypothetical protein